MTVTTSGMTSYPSGQYAVGTPVFGARCYCADAIVRYCDAVSADAELRRFRYRRCSRFDVSGSGCCRWYVIDYCRRVRFSFDRRQVYHRWSFATDVYCWCCESVVNYVDVLRVWIWSAIRYAAAAAACR